MATRTVITISLRPEPGVEPMAAVRALLKVALRRFGLRCVGIVEENAGRAKGRGWHAPAAVQAVSKEPLR